jgi:1-acyl-sn-glycerol-3-phosphate acyltransferase
VEAESATGRAAAVPLAVVRVSAVLFLLVLGILVSSLCGGSPRSRGRVPAALIRRWCRWVVRASGVRVRIDGGAAPDGGLLLVANHVSWLDIPLLAAVRPARMLAKSEIRRWPVAGWLTARSGALFIDRDRVRALPDTVARIAGALRAGEAVTVFPEGSTWCGRAHGPFRRAAFQAALDAGVPVQPVRLRYRVTGGTPSTAPAFIGEDSLLTSVWRVATARGLVAEVEVREPIATGSRRTAGDGAGSGPRSAAHRARTGGRTPPCGRQAIGRGRRGPHRMTRSGYGVRRCRPRRSHGLGPGAHRATRCSRGRRFPHTGRP